MIDYLVTVGHSTESVLRYTLRQLRLYVDASADRMRRQTESLNRRH